MDNNIDKSSLETKIANEIPSLISYFDKNFVYHYVNAKYEEWFGLSKDKILGKTVAELLGQEAFDLIKPKLMRAFAGETLTYETKIPYKNRPSTFIRTQLKPDFNSAGEVVGIIAMVEDFSDLETAYNKLANLDKAKSEFLKIISHELNTPLNGIIGFSNLLKENLQGTEDEFFANQVIDSANRLLALTKTALLITQLNGHTYTLNPSPGNLSELVRGCLQNRLKENPSGVIVKNYLPDELPSVCFEPNLIQQSIEHLIDNVKKHAGNDVELRIEMEESKKNVVLVFNDSGPGFSNDYLSYLFDFFASFDSTRVADQRYGLGLAFINLVMESHGGKITLQNNEMGGACIKLIFLKYQCPNSN